ncbi:hypothetical protein [Paracoccus solventivorans]|uniref:hypothetical protein n=1 Tax=Paracoccus solventivorans TaxID=53463 RepID=UPI0011602F0A|nr:hypothetical protein [Paracoccus solventivorans]
MIVREWTEVNPANDRLTARHALMSHARVTPNPALEVKRREVKVEGFAAWDSDDIAMFARIGRSAPCSGQRSSCYTGRRRARMTP